MFWIDSHCHLDAAEFNADRLEVLARARVAGVQQLVLPAVARSNWNAVRELSAAHGFGYALGIHPLHVNTSNDADLHHLRTQLSLYRADPHLVAVGEIGLDGFAPGCNTPRHEQFYAAQLQLAREFDLPVILHVRQSADRLLKHLRATPVRGGIAHAFNGSEQQALALVSRGFKLGFGGAMTFERALQIRRLAQNLPLSAIVLETDAPDMAPQWLYRTAQERQAGAVMRNEPAELPRMAAVLAQLRGLPLEVVAHHTTQNVTEALWCDAEQLRKQPLGGV
jgi:TatD DNase family protein